MAYVLLNAKLENSTSSLRRLKEFQADGLNRLEELAHEIVQKKQKMTNTESRSGEVNKPARVVAPTRVKGGRSSLIERAAGPSPIMMSSW